MPRAVEAPRDRVIEGWNTTAATPQARATALRRVRLELGLADLRAPAAVVAAQATAEDPELFTGHARDLAPNTPAFQYAHALALAGAGDTGAAILTFGSALWSLAVSLPAQLWLLDNLAIVLLVVVLGASFVFVLLAACQVLPHVAHDLGDLLGRHTPHFARAAALAAIVLLPALLGEGVLGVALALFAIAFAYGSRSTRNVLAMAAVLLVIGLHPLARIASIATTLLDRDPVASSVLAVLDGVESAADVERLEAAFDHDLAAAHALAYLDRRLGLVERSRQRLDAIAEREPADGIVLANRGTIEKRRGDTEAAIAYFERAAAQIDSPTLLFDLSQAYAKAFRMEEYEATLVRAQRIGDEEVAALSSLDDASLVADLGYPVGLLRDRLLTLALSRHDERGAVAMLAPGRLGEQWYVTAGAFAVAALLCLLFAHRWDHASLCVRCGHRICTRCEETVWSEEICDDCHHLFQNPEATDPSLRMARLQALSERETRIDRVVLAGSLAIPGLAGLAARRPDFAMFALLLFAWVATWALWPSGVFADPLLMGDMAVLGFAVPGVLAAIGYVGLVVVSLVFRKSR